MAKTADQIFEISGRKFKIRTDGYNGRELEKLNDLHDKLTASVNTITVKFSADDLSDLFSIILIPADGKPVEDNFDFALAKEGDQIEIYKAFFLERLGTKNRFTSQLRKS
jgi:hypothetical protein